MNKLQELQKRHKELRDEIVAESKRVFSEESKALFEKFPAMNEFSWTQYTPHFNDGDECVFHVREPKVNGVDEYDDEADNLDAEFSAVRTMLNQLDEPAMKEAFGDHMEITIKRDGSVETDYYEHD